MDEITIKADVEMITFDDLLEVIDLFGNISAEPGEAANIIQKYRPLMSYFVVDENGDRVEPEEAEKLIGKMPAVKILPFVQSVVQALTDLSNMMTLPPVKGSS
jgi:hypothetical protein